MFILDYKNSLPKNMLHELYSMEERVKSIHNTLYSQGHEYCNQFDYLNIHSPEKKEALQQVINTGKKLSEECKYLLVIGAGGSYIGTHAILEALQFKSLEARCVLFAGYNLDTEYHKKLLDFLQNKDFAINVISKSGNSIEPILTFELFRNHLEKSIGKKNAQKRIIITTNKKSGILKQIAQEYDYKTFEIPENVVGRYSVLTNVGILPIAFAGINVYECLEGAHAMYTKSKNTDFSKNNVCLYAALRNILYQKNFPVELLAISHMKLIPFGDWWKQLFAESEGKKKKGILPITCQLTNDLHSLWQFIQDGTQILFQTILIVEELDSSLTPIQEKNNFKHFQSLQGKEMHTIHKKIIQEAETIHQENNSPHLIIRIPKITEYTLGALIQFFQQACIVSAQILGVNPFTQPIVDQHKQRFLNCVNHL